MNTTRRRKVHKVSGMRVDEVSLVDYPANAGSTVVLMKRGGPPGQADDDGNNLLEYDDMPQTLEELAKALEDAQTDMAELKKRAETAEEEAARLKKEAEEAKGAFFSLEMKEGGPDTKGDADEEVMKSLPEPIRKRMADMEAANTAMAERLEKQDKERETNVWIKKAASFQHIAGEPQALGGLLYRVAKGLTTRADADTLMKILLGADAAAKDIMTESGAGRVFKGADAYGVVEAKAKERVEKSDGKLTKAQAISEILMEDPALYARYEDERIAGLGVVVD